MELCTIAANPAPPGAVVSMIATRDKRNLRVARWSCGAACAGTVAILPGRAEFIEKYFEVVAELLTRKFDVVVLDWRGQGLSDRALSDRSKGHVKNFSAYERDLDALRSEILEPFCRPPFFALGHSMGGAILIAQARAGRSPFERMVVTAPMIDIYGLRFPHAVRSLVRVLSSLGFGSAFIPGGGGDVPYMARAFEGNVLTSDPVRYARTAEVIAAAPELAIGDPTIAWLNAAFKLLRRFEDAEYPRRILTPILILAAGAEKLVDTAATENFAIRLKVGRCITLPLARHEILFERDALREQFWAAFDAFIPGSVAARDAFASTGSQFGV
jgi:lysophospholipase